MEQPVQEAEVGETSRDPVVRLQPTEVSPEGHSRSPLLRKEMPGLDILRGVAVLSVFFFHASGSIAVSRFSHGALVLRGITSAGWSGVNLFFVLSGFLITGILLDTRKRSNYWSSFYVRRVLRILPVYVVILFLVKFYFHLHWAYVLLCLLYAANMANYFSSTAPIYGPLWSLAVEEQFYLVWPLMVRRLTRQGLTFLSFGIILACPLLRILSITKFTWLGDTSTTWQAADNLAWGAFVAIFLRSRLATVKGVNNLCLLLFCLGGFLFLLLRHFHSLSTKTTLGVALKYDGIVAFFTLALMLALLFGRKAWVLRLSAPIRFFGYISYGFYLFHVLLLYAFNDVFMHFEGPLTVVTAQYLLLRGGIVLLCCTAVSFLSRRYFEERFLLLKERLVPYGVPTATTG